LTNPKFIVENAASLINLAAAIMVLVAQIKSRPSDKKEKKVQEEKPVIIEVNGKRISLPASEQTQKKFLKALQSDQMDSPNCQGPGHR